MGDGGAYAMQQVETLRSQLAEARAEIEAHKKQNANLTLQLDSLTPQLSKEVQLSLERCETIATLRTERAELEADVVWSVEHSTYYEAGEFSWISHSTDVCNFWEEIICDGTPSDILRAVREARAK